MQNFIFCWSRNGEHNLQQIASMVSAVIKLVITICRIRFRVFFHQNTISRFQVLNDGSVFIITGGFITLFFVLWCDVTKPHEIMMIEKYWYLEFMLHESKRYYVHEMIFDTYRVTLHRATKRNGFLMHHATLWDTPKLN